MTIPIDKLLECHSIIVGREGTSNLLWSKEGSPSASPRKYLVRVQPGSEPSGAPPLWVLYMVS